MLDVLKTLSGLVKPKSHGATPKPTMVVSQPVVVEEEPSKKAKKVQKQAQPVVPSIDVEAIKKMGPS